MSDLLITLEMVEAAYARIHEALAHEQRMALWLAALARPGRVSRKPLVIDLDGPLHTKDAPICADEECICADAEYAEMRREAARTNKQGRRNRRLLVNANYEPPRGTLNGNGGFRILR